MSLQSLPFEILTQTIQPLIPSNWNGLSTDSKTGVLKLRTVCRSFNHVVSRCAVRKLGAVAALSLDRRPDRIETVRWLLLTKAKMEYSSRGSPFEYLYRCASFMASQTRQVSSSVPGDWGWLDTVCEVIVASHDTKWVLNLLVGDPSMFPAPETWEFHHGLSFTGAAEFQFDGETIAAAQSTVALPLTSFRGDEEGVAVLLSSGAKPDMCHSVFGKPMYNAAYKNHVHIIKLLATHGGSLQTSGHTLIEVACRQGHIETLQYLLDTIPVRESKKSLSKAFLLACRNGHEEVVRVLLQWVDSMSEMDQTWRELGSHLGFKTIGTRPQINLNCPITNEGTPLAAAVANGNDKAIVRMLTTRDDVQQHFGRSRFCPLWLAVKQDHAPMVGFLLDRYQLEPNFIIKRDLTLLCAAAGLGSASVVRMLLQRSDIDPGFRAQEKHTTPLSLAVLRSHIEVVRLLLEREDIDPNIPARGRRPLEMAVHKGHEAIVRLLLTRHDLNPNLHETSFTPLGAAARLGMKKIVRMLLEQPDTDPNLGHPNSGHSPLRLAIIRHWPHVVKELLQRKDVDTNQPGIHAYMVSEPPLRRPFAPLIEAVSAGSLDGLRQLLSQEIINPNEHHRGQTPLIVAVQSRWIDMVRILLEHPNIDINKTGTGEPYHDEVHIRTAESTTWSYTPTLVLGNGPSSTPLFIACRKGYLDVVSLLIQHARINLKISDDRSRTALWWAAWGGNQEVFTLLLKHCREYINASDFEGWTALHVAVNWGHGAILDMLMGCVELDPNAVNQDGWTALHLAVDRGREAMVSKLLEHPKIDITRRNTNGQTATDLARWRGFEGLADLVGNRGRRLARVRATAKLLFSKYSK